MPSVLIIGYGYTGQRLAARHLARGDHVIATRRNAVPAGDCELLALDLDAPSSTILPSVDRVYYTAPPPTDGREDPRLARLLSVLPPPALFVYFSTTGVYGHRAGAMVDELADLRPESDRARRRVDAERKVQTWCEAQKVPWALLRIAGIYGPGRLPLDRLRHAAVVPDPTGPGNRIHVDDLAAAALAVGDAVRSGAAAGAWNVSDGNPLSTADFNDLVADAVGLPRPRRVPLDSGEISPGLRSFQAETRQIDNRKLLALPGFQLLYPDPAKGVQQSITKLFGNMV